MKPREGTDRRDGVLSVNDVIHEDKDPKTHPFRASWRETYADPDKAVDAIIWASRRWRRMEGVIDAAIAALDRHASQDEVRKILAQVRYDQARKLEAPDSPPPESEAT